MGYFRFFFYTLQTFYRPVPHPLNYYLWKVKKFHGDSVTNESARAKQLQGGAPNAPPPAFIGLRQFK